MERERLEIELTYPIGAVAQRTGLSQHVLRAWERRYAAVSPVRAEGGTRLYSNADVLRLRLLRRATEAGHPIGQVAGRSAEELLVLLREEVAAVGSIPASATRTDEVTQLAAATLEAVEALDGPRIHATLMRAVVALPSGAFVSQLVVPLLTRVGELWAQESLCSAHERLLSVNLRRVLAWMMEASPAPLGAPVLLATTPSEQRHELGAMLAGVVAAEEGWRVVYLGPDLPAEDIARAAVETRAMVVALSVVYGDGSRSIPDEVARLRTLLPNGVTIVVGGRGALSLQEDLAAAGAMILTDLEALRGQLRTLASEVVR